MCGIAGFLDPKGLLSEHGSRLAAMASSLAHRGPDGQGVWIDTMAGCGLVHRRLSVIDLSAEAAQPMQSANGRLILTFNGEIYNYRELRADLERDFGIRSWRGTSDTEVLLAAIACLGLEVALQRANGMFALAVWDREERALYLARDRFGEKPLYYGSSGGVFYFGSELKALRTLPCFERDLDVRATALFLRYGYVPAPLTIYEHASKLPAASILKIEVRDGHALPGAVRSYWSAIDVATRAAANPLTDDVASLIEQTDQSVRRAVALRMHADVPLGAFLSGGVDSSIVVAAMQSQSMRPVQTFSIGFEDATYNESADARRVAEHLGTKHTELTVTAAHALAVIPRLSQIYDEPFADSSQIPTFLVSELARRHVTVALSGDAGDELFGGYNRHVWAPRIWTRLARLPHALRAPMAFAMRATPDVAYRMLEHVGSTFVPALRHRALGSKARKLARVLAARSENELYRQLTSAGSRADPGFGSDAGSPCMVDTPALWPNGLAFGPRMMAMDVVTYLPDDILVKVDRASMANSLEARVPLLDPDLFALAWRLPHEVKVRGDIGKWILRQALYRYVPSVLVDRPKMGFGVPLHAWLRGPLRDWAEDLLAPSSLAAPGLLDPATVGRLWTEHTSGTASHEHELWTVLSLQAWLKHEAG